MDQPLRRRRYLPGRLVGIVAVIVILGCCGLWFWLLPAEQTVRVSRSRIQIATVAEAPFHEYIPLRGEVVPLQTIYLDVAQGGRVEEVRAEAGQRVTAGQVLVRFSDPAMELDAIARETQVIEQMNTQQQLQLQFEQTRTGDAKAIADADYNIVRLGRQVARRAPLAGMGYESQESADNSSDELSYQRRMREIAADAERRDTALVDKSEGLIKDTASRLQDNLTAARRMLDTLVVKAPADGVLTALDAHVGEQKTRGIRLGQIDEAGGFKLTADVDEYYLARVHAGDRVQAEVDGKTADLVVAKVYPEVKNGKFTVDLTWPDGAPADLRPGEAVLGKLELGTEQQSLVLPAGAFLETTGGAWVFVLDSDSEAHRRAVKLGRRSPELIEVLSGLKAGDRVITSDYAGWEQIRKLEIAG
jgi:HlyD family secretion protein